MNKKNETEIEDNHYIGAISYFATGEGEFAYVSNFTIPQCSHGADPLFVFTSRVLEKTTRGNFLRSNCSMEDYAGAIDYFKNGVRIFEVSKLTKKDAEDLSLITSLPAEFFSKTLKNLIKDRGMIDGGLEFFFQYNLS